MKKFFSTLLVIMAVVAVGCGKKKSDNSTVATTPNDCYNQGLNPAYFPNNNWNNSYNNGYSPVPYNNGYNPNNVGCVGTNPNYPINYNYNQYPVNNWNGAPYYVIPNTTCDLNHPYNYDGSPVCPVGTRCQKQRGFYYYTISFGGVSRAGFCEPIY